MSRARTALGRLVREPMVHFAALGALLFVVYGALNRDALRSPDRIVVDGERLQQLAGQFERTWQRPPTGAELEGLVEHWVREEMLYREGLAQGMERGDEVVRRRVVQKMLFLAEDVATAVPTDDELQAWLDGHADRYRVPPRYSLRQVYLDAQRHGSRAGEVGRIVLADLRAGRAPSVADASLLPATLDDAPGEAVAQQFGRAFAEALDTLPLHAWSGPVRSGYGLHLVRLEARTPARAPRLDDVRAAVENDVLADRRERARSELAEALRRRYTVEMAADTAGTP